MRILLAEDERALSRVLTAILTRNRYSVDAVYDGEAAYESVKTGLYDGVILDIMMPKMDGLTVLRKVREDGDLVPVLILSAKAEVEDKVNGLDGGADDYLTKPFFFGRTSGTAAGYDPGPAGCITAAQCGKYHAVPLRVGVGVTFRESLSE